MTKYRTWFVTALILWWFTGCGGGSDRSSSTDTSDKTNQTQQEETQKETPIAYKGLQFYYDNLAPSDYTLKQVTDDAFDAFSDAKKLSVANKLLNSLFFGYPLNALKSRIAHGNFLATIRQQLATEHIDRGALESRLMDDAIFKQYQSKWYAPQAITILTRFYAMDTLDRYFFHNWIAYILTQTILFSPAYELTSTHTPNIANVYNRLVTMLETQAGMRYITYVHMSSEDNWRRFRSPEDNGREMLEIYLLDTDDAHVPLAGKALQNWKLNTDSDTLEVGLNRNTTPLSLFGTTVYTGDDFYRELVKSEPFVVGVTHRLVDFFFPEKNPTAKQKIIDAIVASHPETWQDILMQILFSEEYLLHNTRPQSAEETFYSLAKKIDFHHRRTTFGAFKDWLEGMHQATMKYKLGKLERVPLDTLSFARYHRFIRDEVLLRYSHPEAKDDFDSWKRTGWDLSFIGDERVALDPSDDPGSLKKLVDYLFETLIARKATAQEQELFKKHMIEKRDGKELFRYDFNMFVTYENDPVKQEKEQIRRRRHAAWIVLDYLSRLERTYQQQEEQ